MIQETQYQLSNQSQVSKSSYPSTQESTVSINFGAGCNNFDYNFYKDFEEGNERYYDPNNWKKIGKKLEKNQRE